MRRLNLQLNPSLDPAVRAALLEIERASHDDNIIDMLAPFEITGAFTETRTLDVGTSTLTETQEFIATLISDLKRGGQNRTG
jgi:hypothetical protein